MSCWVCYNLHGVDVFDNKCRLLYLFPQGMNFYTQMKTVTSMWREGDAGGSAALSMPVMKD